ncbi:hypothetical protein [Limnoglobus roseus]|uniref:Uncharacterized protein n=1 Tax=Limnoglobus roseus TaxID=2598579 RepID=A0A5C1AMT7_9BACT|nr:hypothetical protein [Limnoglobus roseus]QEL19433.1 hypothetical protein PX52LOC_06505 [Limnoglobus roseus]
MAAFVASLTAKQREKLAMTSHEFDALTAWGPKRQPPHDWDGVTPYLLLEGRMQVRGWELRAYQFSDGTRLLNNEDLLRVVWSER